MKRDIIFVKNNNGEVVISTENVNTVGELKQHLINNNLATESDFTNSYFYEGLNKTQLESDDSSLPDMKEFSYKGQLGQYNVIALRAKTYKEKYENGSVTTISEEIEKIIESLTNIKTILQSTETEEKQSSFPEGFNPFGLDKKQVDEDEENNNEEDSNDEY